jgi:uncharacterized membrane protein YfhO
VATVVGCWVLAKAKLPAGIYRADVGLRGITVPSGDSRITLDYTPWSVYLGGFVTLVIFLGILAALQRGTFTTRSPRKNAP